MGRLILVAGETGSGKSRYAERVAARAGAHRVYIATMIPQTEENRRRVEHHLRQRAGLDFQTLELSCRVGDAPLGPHTCVLLEDVSNLLANVIFVLGGRWEAVFDDICRLQERSATLVAVTIAGLRPDGYEEETAAYIDSLNRLNKRLSVRADAVIFMGDGSPYAWKGELPDVD